MPSAGKFSYIRSYTEYVCGLGQPYPIRMLEGGSSVPVREGLGSVPTHEGGRYAPLHISGLCHALPTYKTFVVCRTLPRHFGQPSLQRSQRSSNVRVQTILNHLVWILPEASECMLNTAALLAAQPWQQSC